MTRSAGFDRGGRLGRFAGRLGGGFHLGRLGQFPHQGLDELVLGHVMAARNPALACQVGQLFLAQAPQPVDIHTKNSVGTRPRGRPKSHLGNVPVLSGSRSSIPGRIEDTRPHPFSQNGTGVSGVDRPHAATFAGEPTKKGNPSFNRRLPLSELLAGAATPCSARSHPLKVSRWLRGSWCCIHRIKVPPSGRPCYPTFFSLST